MEKFRAQMNFLIGGAMLAAVAFFLIVPLAAFAQGQMGPEGVANPQETSAPAPSTFVSLTNIPGLTQSADLPTLLKNLFLITIGFAAILGVIMIAIGGVEYMGSDKVFTKTNGRNRIMAAFQGLFIILASYLILNTINPQLLSVNVLLPPGGATGTSGSSGLVIFTFPPGGVADQNYMNECTNAHGTAQSDGNGNMVCKQ
jgi:hypothetical protein